MALLLGGSCTGLVLTWFYYLYFCGTIVQQKTLAISVNDGQQYLCCAPTKKEHFLLPCVLLLLLVLVRVLVLPLLLVLCCYQGTLLAPMCPPSTVWD